MDSVGLNSVFFDVRLLQLRFSNNRWKYDLESASFRFFSNINEQGQISKKLGRHLNRKALTKSMPPQFICVTTY